MKLTKLKTMAALMLSLAAVATLFQNCGAASPNESPLYDRTSLSSCIGPTCVPDLNYLNLFVANADPILITRDTERAVDLGGYCDTAGYPDSKIYVELKTGSTTVVGPYTSIAKCDSNGRFRLLVELPANYDYNLAYAIVLTFRAVDNAGNEYDHPTGVNRRELTLLTAP